MSRWVRRSWVRRSKTRRGLGSSRGMTELEWWDTGLQSRRPIVSLVEGGTHLREIVMMGCKWCRGSWKGSSKRIGAFVGLSKVIHINKSFPCIVLIGKDWRDSHLESLRANLNLKPWDEG
jgi:hypothetical protein